MKGSLIILLFILFSIYAKCGIITNCGLYEQKIYKLSNDNKYLVEIDKKIIKIFDHSNEDFLFEISDINDQIILSEIGPDNNTIMVILKNYSGRLYQLSSGKLLQTMNGHSAEINSAVFSPNGKFLVTASDDKTVHIWDVTSGKAIRILRGHTNFVNSAVFSPDGKFILTASSDNTARIFDVNTGKELQVLTHTDLLWTAIFSPTGAEILTTTQTSASIWNTKNGGYIGKVNLRDFDLQIGKGIFTSDGQSFLICNDKLILKYNLRNLTLINKIEQSPNGRQTINYIKITGNNILTLLNCNNECITWDLNSNSKLFVGNFFTNDSNFKYDKETGSFSEYSFSEKKSINNGFFYVLLESRPRIFLISCAADKYTPPLSNLQNCKSDAQRIIKYFEKSKELEKQIEELKVLITKNSNELHKAKLNSLQLLLCKTPVIFVDSLYDYKMNKSSIIKAFKNVKNQMRFDDAFVFHFAGMGGTIKNTEVSTLFFSSDTTTFTAEDLFQLSEIINGNNQLFLLDACQDDFVNQFKSEILNSKVNSQLINRNRVLLAIKGIAVDNYKGTGGAVLTHAFVNNNIPFNQVFSFDSREKNEYDYNLYNGTTELKEDRFINFEILRESDYYDVKFKEKNKSRGVIITTKEKVVEKPNTISKGQTLSVVVGINAYSNLTPLTNPLLDAEKVAKILESQYGHKVILLKDINYMSLADSLLAVREKYEFVEGSQFLLYFAGHGGFNKYDNSSCLLFRDSKLNSSGIFDNAMSSAMLKGLINQIKATRTMVVIDACHSRKLTEECKEAECMALDQSKQFDEKVMDSYLKSPGKVIFTSANVFQEASDGDPYKYSPFANAFIASLEERSLRKIEFDSKTVYKDMLNYQADKSKNKHFQSEMKYCSYNDSNKDDDRFIFIPK